jgi:hypothetical protein
MKATHHTIAAVILAAVFVIVGFAAEISMALGAAGIVVSYIGYVLTLVGFLILIWVILLVLMHKDPYLSGPGRNRRRR